MRQGPQQRARAEALEKRARLLVKRHGIDLAPTLNRKIPHEPTRLIEGVLHELAHYLVVSQRPPKDIKDAMEAMLHPFTPYVTDQMEIDAAYTTLEAGIELGIWSWRGAYPMITAATAVSLRAVKGNCIRFVARELRTRHEDPGVALAERVGWLKDWFENDEARARIPRAKDEARIVLAANTQGSA